MSKSETNLIIFALVLVLVLIIVNPLVSALVALAAFLIFALYKYLQLKKII